MQLQNFVESEFACPCCGKNDMAEAFLRALDVARSLAGIPFRLTSACRCQKHNAEVGGSDSSSHVKGCAVDIACTDSVARWRIVSALIRAGFTRIGIGKNFIHVDLDMDKPQNVIWTYYKEG